MSDSVQAAILDSLAEGVLAVDHQGRILSVNPAARQLLGLNPKGSVFSSVRQPELHDLIREVLKTREPAQRHLAVFTPRERHLRANGVPWPGGVVLVLQDVSVQHGYDRLRREFVANVSHELKSPLTSIRSLTETLLEGALDDPHASRRFTALIEEDSVRLSRLIDDLLVLSQEESRGSLPRFEPVELSGVIEDGLARLEVLLQERGLALQLELQPVTIQGDRDRLRQVFDNLLDNAVKYSPPRGTLSVRTLQDGEHASVVVTDQGPGIPKEALTRVFERFYRVDKTRSRELGGTGLGLSIVKHIVESHGGRTWVESDGSSGSSFTVLLPLSQTALAVSEEPAEEHESGEPQDLASLQEKLLVMGAMVEEAVGEAVHALILRDAARARAVIERDSRIDRAENALDELCLKLLAEQRPDEEGLRLVAMAFKINAELERMGDLAAAIAWQTLEYLKAPLLQPLTELASMAEKVQTLVKSSLDAFVHRDVAAALEICRNDDVVDRLNRSLHQELQKQMQTQSQHVDRCLALLLIARSLERIADHATNVAESVVYLVQGRSIKHRLKRR